MFPSFVRRAKLEPLKILFQDKHVFVIDKPAGLVSQGGIDHDRAAKGEPTIEDHFYDLKIRLNLPEGHWIRNVHRLDKSTTGPLILATTEQKARDLCQQFKERSVEKSYIAAISRYLLPEERAMEGEHVGWMESDDGLVSLSEEGKEGAREVKTEWEWLGGDPALNISLLRLRPKTGHKHQLRLFASRFLRAPIIGDTLYRFPSYSSPNRHPISNVVHLRKDRVLLHCEEITFSRYVKSLPPLDAVPGRGKRGGKARRVRETVRAGLGEDWGAVLGKMSVRRDEEDEVWRAAGEEAWVREMGGERSEPGAGGDYEEGELRTGAGAYVEAGEGGERSTVVDVEGGPRWEAGTGGGKTATMGRRVAFARGTKVREARRD